MSANTETTGAPPKGYKACRDNCGRYRHPNVWRCWECYFARNPARRGELAEQALAEPDWTPPIAAPDFEHQALCRVERGGSCNCVPIAAPAAHVERRKGQRWRVKRDNQPAYETTLDARDCDGWFTVTSRGGGWIHDDCWDLPAYTMTLLADAPPEPLTAKDVFGEIPPGSKFTNETPVKFASAPPAKEVPQPAPSGDTMNVCACNYTTCTPRRCAMKDYPPAQEAPVTIACAKACGRSTVNDARAMSWTCKQCRTQEAPKAAPACARCQSTDDVRDTRFDAIKRLYCKPCRSGLEAWLSVQTGERRTAGPALIDRGLAADRVEDCLPEAGR